MNTLEDRRKINQIIFIVSLIFGKISSPSLLNELNIRIPQRITRDNMNHFFSELNLNKENPICIMKRIYNEHVEFIDFNMSIESIKRKLKNHFSENVHKN